MFYFAGTGDGKFSVCKMFQEIEGYNNTSISEEWMLIWKLAVLERCRSFIRLLKHDRILTNYSNTKKGLRVAGCVLCGEVSETTLHALCDYSKSMHVWRSLVSSAIMEDFYKMDLKDWITINLNYCSIRNEN